MIMNWMILVAKAGEGVASGDSVNRNTGKCLRPRAVGVEPAPHSKMRAYVGPRTIEYIWQIEAVKQSSSLRSSYR